MILLGPFSIAQSRISCQRQIKKTDSFLVANAAGDILFEKNARKPRIPASTLKVLTSLAAFHYLGEDFRFKTTFHTDQQGNLKIKGYGDPLLISEVLHLISNDLSAMTGKIGDIILDISYFDPEIEIPGCDNSCNPYDAPVGALCANFNTVAFRVKKNGGVYSTEKQTPMVPYMKRKIRQQGLRSGRRTFTHNSRDAALYLGELVCHLLKKRGVKVLGVVRFGEVEPKDRLLLEYRSIFSLEMVVQKMLHSSSNFMANQLFLALGARQYGAPATLEKGVRAATAYAARELGLKDFRLVEGSGLSRKNRLTARDMLRILKKFKPYKDLMRRKGDEIYKTGSLRGIKTRAGYIEHDFEGAYYFAVFFNRSGAGMGSMMRCIQKAVDGKNKGLIQVEPRYDAPSFSNTR